MKNIIFTIFSLILITLSAVNSSTYGQRVIDLAKSPELTIEDLQPAVNEISNLSADDLRTMLSNVKPDMSPEQAIKGLPDNLQKSMLDQQSDRRLWSASNRAAKITTARYEFILINSPSPAAISDSNCLLLVTKGMLEKANNQDGLVGVIMHELAHGLYAAQTLQARLKFNKGVREKKAEMMFQARKELALIEIKCDLVAAKLMANARMNVPSYIEILNLLETYRNNDPVQWHPVAPVRVKAINLLINSDASIAGILKK